MGVQGRDAGGIASFANASEGGQVLAEPTSEAAPPCQHSWREVPDSLALKAKSEHTAVLPGVPWATETAVLSPHILPGVPSMVQLRSLQRPASCWHGPCSSSATGNSGAMGHTNLAHPKLSPPPPPALLLWAQSSSCSTT